MVFPAFGIEGDEGRRPLDIKIRGQGLGIELDLEWDQVLVDEAYDLTIWIRHGIHLLTTDSTRIKEVEQHVLLFRSGPRQSRVHCILPFDFLSHGYTSFYL